MSLQSELGRKRNYFLPLACILLLLVSDGLRCYTELSYSSSCVFAHKSDALVCMPGTGSFAI